MWLMQASDAVPICVYSVDISVILPLVMPLAMLLVGCWWAVGGCAGYRA